ncbi:hypothetical protein X801_02450, partial [Opisthorchis viverrini]
MNNLHLLEYGCNGPLVACAQEPRNQPATDRTTTTLYYRVVNAESRETCLANIVQTVSDTVNSVVGGAQLTVTKAEWGTSEITTTALDVTSKVLFELRKDLFSRWFNPLTTVAPFATNCIHTEGDRFHTTVLMSAYFNANEKNAAQIAEMKRQVENAADGASGEEESENIIHLFSAEGMTDEDNNNNNVVTDNDNTYDIDEEEGDDEEDTEETTTEDTDSEPEISIGGGVDDLAIKITPVISAVSGSPWDRLYKKLSGLNTKLYDVCDLLMPTLRSVKFECSAALVACSQEPQNQPADQGTSVTLYYRLPPAELRDSCIQGVVIQVDGYVLRTYWETSKQTGDTPVPTAKVIYHLRKDLFERWLATSGDIKPLAINCLWTMAGILKVTWMSIYFDFAKFAEVENVETWIENVLDQRGDSVALEDYVDDVMACKKCKKLGGT